MADRGIAWRLGALLLTLGGAGACADRASGPLVPSAIQFTPAAVLAGVAGTPTPRTLGTPTLPATRLVPPPEPLDVPEGFAVGVYADGVGPVSGLAVAPNGDVFATVSSENRLIVLPDRDRDGVSEAAAVFAEGAGLNMPNDVAFAADGLYVANTDGVTRWPYAAGDLAARGPAEVVLPLPGAGVGWRRALASAPDGALFVSVGASCNVCTEEDPRRAAVLRYLPGRPIQAFANGLRAVGDLAVDPRTGALWATDLGRAGLGDALPPEELNLITAGGNYGWPWCFGQRVPDTSLGAQVATCADTVPPAVMFGARTEPLGMAFGAGAGLPPEWRDDLFVALHGSSTGLPVGFKVVRVPFVGGGPAGEAEDFVIGWLRADTRRWGRPSSIAVAPDGALLIGDEGGGRIYRVTYAPATPVPTPIF